MLQCYKCYSYLFNLHHCIIFYINNSLFKKNNGNYVIVALVTIIELHFLLVIKEYYIEIKFIELEAKEKESKITTDADVI